MPKLPHTIRIWERKPDPDPTTHYLERFQVDVIGADAVFHAVGASPAEALIEAGHFLASLEKSSLQSRNIPDV